MDPLDAVYEGNDLIQSKMVSMPVLFVTAVESVPRDTPDYVLPRYLADIYIKDVTISYCTEYLKVLQNRRKLFIGN